MFRVRNKDCCCYYFYYYYYVCAFDPFDCGLVTVSHLGYILTKTLQQL